MIRLGIAFAIVTVALVWSSLGLGPVGGAARAESPQGAQDPQFENALQAGEQALRERRFDAALAAFTSANEMHDRKSPQALYGICRAHNGLGAADEAEKACAEGLSQIGGDTRLVAGLRYERGVARVARASGLGDRRLRDARDDLDAAVKLTNEIPMAWFNLGVVSAMLGRDDESLVAFQAYLESGEGSMDEMARELLYSPRRVREPVAPELSLQTLDHGIVNLKDLRGRTVLLDFWATWCGPCQIAEPAIARLRKKYADQPFSIVGIDYDPPIQEPRIRAYIERHDMAWPQHIDANESVLDAYDVEGFPTYILIDGDGIVSLRLLGWEGNTELRLDREIAKNVKAIAAKPVRR